MGGCRPPHEPDPPVRIQRSAIPDQRSAIPDQRSAIPDQRSAIPDQRSAINDVNDAARTNEGFEVQHADRGTVARVVQRRVCVRAQVR